MHKVMGWVVKLDDMESSFPGMGHSDTMWVDVIMGEFKSVRDEDHALGPSHS